MGKSIFPIYEMTWNGEGFRLHRWILGTIVSQMKTWKIFAAFVLGSGLLRAEIHGPILQWHQDPQTTMTISWIERTVQTGVEKKWAWGRAGFGYGDDDDATVFPKMQKRFRSIYVRRTFDWDKEKMPESLVMRLRYDDGVVVYLNGEEILRKGVEGSGNTVQSVEGHEATSWEQFVLKRAVKHLKKGKNVIAIEVHNQNLGSSDLSLDAALWLVSEKQNIQMFAAGDWWQYLANGVPEKGWASESPKVPAGVPMNTRFATALYVRERGEGKWRTDLKPKTKPFGKANAYVRSAVLTGLKPGTDYEYKVVGDDATGWFTTAPEKLPVGTKFVTGGDMFHTRELLDAMNRRAGLEDPMFALLGGDLAYANGVSAERWYQWVDSWRELAVAPDGRVIPMVVAIGNHEVKGAAYRPTNAPPVSDSPFFYSLFELPKGKSNYGLHFGDDLSLVMLDSGHTQNVVDQNDWLKRELEACEKAAYTFVCYHRPAYGTGVKGDAKHIQKHWSPMFEKRGVEAVFENDHHTYKRTKPLVNGKVKEGGVLYLGDGSWGVNVRKITQEMLKGRDWLAYSGPINHLIRVTMDGGKVHYHAVRANGEVFDKTTQPVRK